MDEDADNHPFGWQPEDFRVDDAGQMAEYDPWVDLSAEGDSEYDEPVPPAEYDDELREPLHVADVVDADFWKRVGIDEFISGVSEVSVEQRTRIVRLLAALGRTHLLSWLPRYNWTGHSLILFLEFRVIWKANRHWHWWQRGGEWGAAYYNSGNLSRYQMRELILRRLHCSAEEVINKTWYADWKNGEMWRRGFQKFADFALFRADLGEDKDWRTYLPSLEGGNRANAVPTPYWSFLQSEEIEALTEPDYDYQVGEDYLSYRRSRGAPQWYAIQDWYDPSEWHDNLGW